ncbi:MAG: LPS-assembly protein LptD [Proteobacteria bacterium]|nr:MAG: LPS-assembly protein LptD [Pseudomonadota bacterium]
MTGSTRTGRGCRARSSPYTTRICQVALRTNLNKALQDMRESGIKRPLALEVNSVLRCRWRVLGVGLAMLTGTSTVAADDSLFFAGPQVCPRDIIDIPEVVAKSAGLDPNTQEIILESDQIDAPDGNTLILTGNAQVIQGPQAIFAEEIVYDKEAYTVNATDNVTLYSPGGDKLDMAKLMLEMETFIGEADAVDFQLGSRESTRRKRRLMDSEDTRSGAFGLDGLEDVDWLSDRGAESRFNPSREDDDEQAAKGPARANIRGEAERMFFEGRDRQRLEKTAITSCPEGQDSVFLKASEITLDHATGIGTGEHMTIRFFRVPIFYFPRASFPINDERKTGFLFPSIGSSDTSGTIVEVPYYINIAPDKDATVHMRYLSDRGVQIMGEYRYLGEDYDGIFRAEILPGDDVYGDDRYAVGFDHEHEFGKNWDADIDVQDVSDADYFDDFSNDIDISSSSFLDQRASVRYTGDIVRFEASALDYVNINPDIDENAEPYGRLPRLTLDAETPASFDGPFEFGLESELVRFVHPGERIDGTRLDLSPYVSMPWENVYASVEPKIRVQHTSYDLDNVNPGDEDSPNLTVPIFSLDASIAFERDTTWNDRPHYQTLEPRLYYAYAPEEDQDDIPIFDTGGGNLSNISNYFRDNRFFGPDRVGDENRVTLGLTSRIIDTENGQQRLEAEIAQIFYLDDRLVHLSPGAEPETDDKSRLLAEISANLNPRWEVGGSLEYDHEDGETKVVRLDTEYLRDSRRRFEMSYWYFKDSTQQLDVDLSWPIAPKWQFGLSDIYDIEEGENLATSVSVTYDACCWAARVTGQQRQHRDEEDDTAIFFTLELKNLGRFSTYY